MYVFADLSTGADGGPCIHHSALINIGTDIHKAGHQHHILTDETTAPCNRRRDYTKTAFFKLMGVVAGKLGRHFVEVAHRSAIHQCIVLEPE